MKKVLFIIASVAICTSVFAQPFGDAKELLKEDVTRSMNLHHNYEVPMDAVYTPVPKGYKPFYVSHYGRHGSRYHWTSSHLDRGVSVMDSLAAHNLLTEEGLSVREDLQKIKEAHEGVLGYLTHKGGMQHQGIAHRLSERNPRLFTQKDRNEVYAVATTAQRCIQSMAFFCVQLARENPELQFTMDAGERFADYLSNPAGLEPRGEERVRVILDSLLTSSLDPSRIMALWITDETAAKNYMPKGSERLFIYYVFWAGGIGQCLDIEDPYIYRHFTEDEIYALWAYNDTYYYSNMCATEENGRSRDIIAKRIVRDIVEKADSALCPQSHRVADLRFGHDSALAPLMSFLHVKGLETEQSVSKATSVWYGFQNMPMASNLQIVFYKNKKGDILVEMLFNERETSIPALGSGPYYNWTELRDYLVGICE